MIKLQNKLRRLGPTMTQDSMFAPDIAFITLKNINLLLHYASLTDWMLQQLESYVSNKQNVQGSSFKYGTKNKIGSNSSSQIQATVKFGFSSITCP